MRSPGRLLGPPVAVVLLAGGVAAATYQDDASAPATGDQATETTTTRPHEGAEDDDSGAGTTSTTRVGASASSTTTPGTAPGPSTSTTRPSSTTSTTARSSGPGTTAASAPPTTAPPPADLVVHLTGSDVVTVTVENAGPGSAPGITVVLSGVDGLQANQLTVGSGVDCFGDGTVTCTVAATGVGGRVGELDVPVPAGRCLTVTVTSEVDDPHPGDNRRQRGDC